MLGDIKSWRKGTHNHRRALGENTEKLKLKDMWSQKLGQLREKIGSNG